jgi:hypothetical protein
MTDDDNDNHPDCGTRTKLARPARDSGIPFSQRFPRDATAAICCIAYGDRTPECSTRIRRGRRSPAHDVQARHGQGDFAKLKDRSGLIQIFLQQEPLAQSYDDVQGLGLSATSSRLKVRCFKTKTGSCRFARTRAVARQVAAPLRQVARPRRLREPVSSALRRLIVSEVKP